MKKIAILGAGGFVGSRMVELALLTKAFEVVPIVRSPKGAARLSRLGQIWKFGDAGKPDQLIPLIKGCDAVVNLTIGDYDGMAGTAESAWSACVAAGVPKLIHMSTAEVYGRVEAAGTSDDSPPLKNHWMSYARAKAAAEAQLRLHFDDKRIGTVVLRPGLIWGIRSPWVEGPAAMMVAGKAFLMDGGKGVCNLINVDNLIQQILQVVNHPTLVSGCFNISDDETLNWHQYYTALAKEIGLKFDTIHQLPAAPFKANMSSRMDAFKQSGAAKWLKKKLSRDAKSMLKAKLASFQPVTPASGPVPPPQPTIDQGGWHLHNVRHKLSNTKFRKTFGRGNELTFPEAMARTGEWLRYSGFNQQ